jgi:hypothetical protein
MRQLCTASCLVNEIQKAVISLTDYKIQTETADLINKSFAFRRESETAGTGGKISRKNIKIQNIRNKKQRCRQLF